MQDLLGVLPKDLVSRVAMAQDDTSSQADETERAADTMRILNRPSPSVFETVPDSHSKPGSEQQGGDSGFGIVKTLRTPGARIGVLDPGYSNIKRVVGPEQ